MPNWTYNEIKTDDPTIITRYMTDENFDFNKIIPMPKSLDVEDSSLTDLSIAYYLSDRLTKTAEECGLNRFVDNTPYYENWGEELLRRLGEKPNYKERFGKTEDEFFALGKTYVENLEKYNAKTWYKWRWNNWGCKWNACDTLVSDDGTTVSFSTPWCEPQGIFEALCEKFPDAELRLFSEYEDGAIRESENRNGTPFVILEFNQDEED